MKAISYHINVEGTPDGQECIGEEGELIEFKNKRVFDSLKEAQAFVRIHELAQKYPDNKFWIVGNEYDTEPKIGIVFHLNGLDCKIVESIYFGDHLHWRIVFERNGKEEWGWIPHSILVNNQ